MTNNIGTFELIKIGLASPDLITKWSKGEVKKPETINYRTLKPEKDGLFCEKIFGPTKDWECYCGKYKKVRFKGIICERCGVEITRSKVRRERMGHIKLAAPISHIWYFKGVPSRMGYLLDLAPKDLEKVLYFASNIVVSVKEEKRKEDLPRLEAEYLADLDRLDADYHNEVTAEQQRYEREVALMNLEREPEEGEEARPKKATKAELNKALKLHTDKLTRLLHRYEDQRDQYRNVFEKFKGLKLKLLLHDEREYKTLKANYGTYFEAMSGAAAIEVLLKAIDLKIEEEALRKVIKKAKGQKKNRAVKRLKVVSAFRRSNNKPEWMILKAIPVIPPDLRPMVQLDGGRFATSDLNDLYRRVINRNNRLVRLLGLGAPEIIVNNEKRMLQEAVDSLLDNGRRGRPVTGPGNRPLKSLSDMLKGKQGRFRQNLLGKRVDYSGRSVIVVGPQLKLHQCGLPKVMALELFKPFVMHLLVEKGYANNIKSARKLIERQKPIVWDVLEEAIKEHPVLLNRAPTLHRLGIQAFEPVLVEGKAIQIHPLVCAGFNADFDGDQMAVHLPLSAEAQAEARLLMLSVNNILSPAHGKPVTTPSQDMVLGIYNLTASRKGVKGEGMYFSSADEALLALDCGEVHLQAEVKIRTQKKVLETTVGRLIFNRALPSKFNEECDKPIFTSFVNKTIGKKDLTEIIEKCATELDRATTADILDRVKNLGFQFSSEAGITIAVDDIIIPENKWQLLETPEAEVEKAESMYAKGLITENERYQRVIEIWTQATEDVADAMEENFRKDDFNPVYMMATSGARGNLKQIRQLAAIRGLVSNPKGEVIDRPIKANFREGLTVLEYFISTHGARKGLADTALRTADSGYLTRRLVDVSQDVIVREDDCGTVKSIPMRVFRDRDRSDLNRSLYGRVVAEKIVGEEKEVIAKKNDEIDDKLMKKLEKSGLDEIRVRSVVHCEAQKGICSKCYGWSLADRHLVEIGEASGIVAAQSIGEPGTQLTMRTFHTGGVAGEDITHGLPRVVELFEARKPKGQAILAEISGTIDLRDNEAENQRTIMIIGSEGKEKAYPISRRARILVENGAKVKAGDQLTDGSLNPHDILAIKGIDAVQAYIVKEVQAVYHSQGVEIDDRHIELIVRQMTKKVQIAESGDTELLPGEVKDRLALEIENEKVAKDGGELATAKNMLLGITKASLQTDSFLSAASFQETTRVLTEAAIANKVDPLLGLKENVIIGKLIPAATGLTQNRILQVLVDGEITEEIPVSGLDEGLEEGMADLQADAQNFLGLTKEDFERGGISTSTEDELLGMGLLEGGASEGVSNNGEDAFAGDFSEEEDLLDEGSLEDILKNALDDDPVSADEE